jgi:hypothetical protein
MSYRSIQVDKESDDDASTSVHSQVVADAASVVASPSSNSSKTRSSYQTNRSNKRTDLVSPTEGNKYFGAASSPFEEEQHDDAVPSMSPINKAFKEINFGTKIQKMDSKHLSTLLKQNLCILLLLSWDSNRDIEITILCMLQQLWMHWQKKKVMSKARSKQNLYLTFHLCQNPKHLHISLELKLDRGLILSESLANQMFLLALETVFLFSKKLDLALIQAAFFETNNGMTSSARMKEGMHLAQRKNSSRKKRSVERVESSGEYEDDEDAGRSNNVNKWHFNENEVN